ncbi:GntR family transcriptional regulator [Streptomyces sp. NPDC006552]|uniref:GntR family transcriptional regulator n=1 Tax=Streptomyces sp. NPDC006552 TaxID=3157179 RepID=UPI0033A19667
MPSPKQPPKWRQIADEVAAQIANGEYAPNDRLPSVQSQVAAGKGATATVHRAYQALEAEGIVRTVFGSGTIVLGPGDAPTTFLTGAARLDRLRRTGHPFTPGETYVNPRSVLRSCADEQIAELLNIELYDEVVVRSRTFVKNDRIMALALNIIHTRALGPLPELLDESPMPKFRHDLYAERTGMTITAGPEKSAARIASTQELADFNIDVAPDVDIPILVLRTVYSDDDGPLEVWEDVLRPGMWHTRS